MDNSDEGPPASSSEVGYDELQLEETKPLPDEFSAMKLLSNMEALLSRMISMSQTPSTSSSATQLLQFNPDDGETDIEGRN